MQSDLLTLGYDPDGIDGMMGTRTETALKRFCEDFELAGDLPGTLFHFARIAEKHPDWKGITLSEDFELWINEKARSQELAILKLKRSGTFRQIIALLDGYKKYALARAEKGKEIKKEGFVVYRLTEEDLTALGAEGGIIDRLEKLEEKKYENKKDFLSAVEPIIQEGTSEYNSFLYSVLEYAKNPSEYALTGESIKSLKAENIPENVLEPLRELIGVGYASRAELQEVVAKAIRGTIDKYKSTVAILSEESTKYKLTEKSIEEIRSEKVPEEILCKIGELQDVVYDDKEELGSAIKAKIEEVHDKYQDYLPSVLKHAKILVAYRLGEKSFEKMESECLPTDLLARLRKLEGKIYLGKEKLEKAVNKEIDAVAEEYNGYQKNIVDQAVEENIYTLSHQSIKAIQEGGIPEDVIKRISGLKGKIYGTEEDLKKAVGQKIEEVAFQYEKYPYLVEKYADRSDTYELNEPFFKRLGSELRYERFVPAKVLNMISELQGVEYPSANIFKQALRYAVDRKIEEYQSKIMQGVDEVAKSGLSGQSFSRLKDALKDKEVPAGVVAMLEGLVGVRFSEEKLYEKSLKEAVGLLSGQYEDSLDLILKKAQKVHPYPKDVEPLLWESKSCDCGPKFHQEAYGFHPFWSEGETQVIDFSGLSRIGYFALSFDGKGNFDENLHWEKEKGAFVIEAHKYKTKVDLVISSAAWGEWVGSAVRGGFQATAIEELSQKIVELAEVEFDAHAFDMLSRKTSDGVTINFDSFPAEQKYAPVFLRFITTLREKLKAADERFYLNVMLPMTDIGKGIYSFENLKKMVSDKIESEPGHTDTVDLFIVFIGEPTTDTKKLLRRMVADNFHGAQRRNVLRKIVPVISPVREDSDRFPQFDDDLIYFQDNYGGVGFWPLPGGDEGGFEKLNALVKEGFKVEGEPTEFPWRFNEVCPNRWYLHLLWDALAVFFIFYALLTCFSYWARDFCAKHPILFFLLGAITILNTALLYLYGRSREMPEIKLMLIMLGVSLLFLTRRMYIRSKSKDFP